MCTEQEAFDEAFTELVAETALDDVIERLADVGVHVLPWQRHVLAQWLWLDEDKPLSVRVFRLQRALRDHPERLAAEADH